MRHFEYYRLKRNWEFVWDCYQGSDAVKRGKNARIYLPMLRREREEYERSGKTRAPHYELRKSSASYENLFKPVVDDIVGIMQKNAPTRSPPNRSARSGGTGTSTTTALRA